jgi:hypothetical protein
MPLPLATVMFAKCETSNGGTIGTLAVEAQYRVAGGASNNLHLWHFVQDEGVQLSEHASVCSTATLIAWRK